MKLKCDIISVALCTYNGGQFLQRQLDSILHQTVPVNEIVVVDDVSTDNTISILDDYAAKYPGIFNIIKNKKNTGARKNFEKALSLCKGDIIFLSDHDDSWSGFKVQKVIAHFEAHPEDKVVFTNASFIDENDQVIPSLLWDVNMFTKEMREFTADKKNLLRFMLKYNKIVTGATVAIRKDFVDKILPFRLMHKLWHDAWIAIVAANHFALGYIDEPLIQYRLHRKQQVGWLYIQKINRIMEGIDPVPDLVRKEMNNTVEESELVELVHIRRKRVRLIKRLSRFIQLDKQIADEIREECRLAEKAYIRTKSFPVRLVETFRKMFK
ncbi:Glycosyl transferase family 2 [Chitinophaga sp. CF118]|uniref:glycosyltransferase n=1 Tax=Chitinophaga sp. CF118 TaxID=1884367 RepID=UPI0008E1665C|nr:glycosyltransferase [Chitinophaga sp. CF118]SFE27818.1 Glycosyl transferase family 2 [Chitinophaga sp. CF118]